MTRTRHTRCYISSKYCLLYRYYWTTTPFPLDSTKQIPTTKDGESRICVWLFEPLAYLSHDILQMWLCGFPHHSHSRRTMSSGEKIIHIVVGSLCEHYRQQADVEIFFPTCLALSTLTVLSFSVMPLVMLCRSLVRSKGLFSQSKSWRCLFLPRYYVSLSLRPVPYTVYRETTVAEFLHRLWVNKVAIAKYINNRHCTVIRGKFRVGDTGQFLLFVFSAPFAISHMTGLSKTWLCAMRLSIIRINNSNVIWRSGLRTSSSLGGGGAYVSRMSIRVSIDCVRSCPREARAYAFSFQTWVTVLSPYIISRTSEDRNSPWNIRCRPSSSSWYETYLSTRWLASVCCHQAHCKTIYCF